MNREYMTIWEFIVAPEHAKDFERTYGADALRGLLGMPPHGDASLILAHQLIAAKLNVATGAPAPAEIAAADAWIAARRLPIGVKDPTATALTARSGPNAVARGRTNFTRRRARVKGQPQTDRAVARGRCQRPAPVARDQGSRLIFTLGGCSDLLMAAQFLLWLSHDPPVEK